MEEEVDNTPFKQMVGSLRYLCNNRPDICFAVGVISRYMHQPKKVHLLAAKRVLRYIKGTIGFGMEIAVTEEAQVGFCSSLWEHQSHGALKNSQW